MKIIGFIVLLVTLGAMFLSLFHMSFGMEMSGGMTNCPLMSHEDTICPMELSEHLGIWKGIFITILPTILLLITSAILVVTISKMVDFFARRSKPIPLCCIRFKIHLYTYPYRPLQEFFSSGILHPKLF